MNIGLYKLLTDKMHEYYVFLNFLYAFIYGNIGSIMGPNVTFYSKLFKVHQSCMQACDVCAGEGIQYNLPACFGVLTQPHV